MLGGGEDLPGQFRGGGVPVTVPLQPAGSPIMERVLYFKAGKNERLWGR